MNLLNPVCKLNSMHELNFAPGVTFDEAKHEYWYKGKQLSGITRLISKKLGLKYPEHLMSEHVAEGIHIHKAVQKWIETGNPDSIHPDVQWLISQFDRDLLYSEVLVSDFKQYASAVDIAEVVDTDGINIYDIKKGVFKREYVTWQLSIYKYFIEKYANRVVRRCECVCLKDKEVYPIFPKSIEQVEKLLYS